MTYKDIYNDLKAGVWFEDESNTKYIGIGTCDRYGSPSYGKDYIYYANYGSSAITVNFKDFCCVMRDIFRMKANEFYKTFKAS